MESNKTSKKTTKIAGKAVPSSEGKINESKPVTRTRTAARSQDTLPKAETSAPKTSHRHSKVSVPATPIVEEVVANVVVDTPKPIPHEDVAHHVVAAPQKPVSQEEVARLAYSFWEARNNELGSPEEDWFRAMKVLAATA